MRCRGGELRRPSHSEGSADEIARRLRTGNKGIWAVAAASWRLQAVGLTLPPAGAFFALSPALL